MHPVAAGCSSRHGWGLVDLLAVRRRLFSRFAALGGAASGASCSCSVEPDLVQTLQLTPLVQLCCCVWCPLQVADALSLQFRLPPPGVPPPLPRSSQEVLGGCPVVDALLLTSVWAVAALRQLAQVRGARQGPLRCVS